MNEKLREALAIVEKYGMKGDVIYKEIEALAASKPEPQAQAGEPKTLEWMEQPRHIADAATIRLLTEAIAKKDAALKACVEALEWCVKQGGGPVCEHEAGVCFCRELSAITKTEEAMK